MRMRCTNTISCPEIHSRPQRSRSFGANQKERDLWGRERREWANYRKQEILSKVIAGIAQRDGNVSLPFH